MGEENKIEKLDCGITGTIQITVQRTLRPNQRKVYDLIMDCIKSKRILDEDLLQDWFMEKVVKPRKKIIDGKYIGKDERGWNVYERVSEYETRKAQIANDGRLHYWHLTEAKQMLKYSIGALVMRGYLTVLPSIKLKDDPEPTQIENQ